DDVTFVLTSGGHNAGIVSAPGRPRRHFRIATKQADAPCLSAEEWLAQATLREGSWWPAWIEWLEGRVATERVTPPPLGAPDQGYAPLEAAPGTYVFQR